MSSSVRCCQKLDQHQSIGDLMHLVVEPMLRDRIVIAKSGGGGKLAETADIAMLGSKPNHPIDQY